MREELTNEELAIRIKAGELERMAELWGNNKKLITLLALRHRYIIEAHSFVDMDDLMQCGYFALSDAVQEYTPDKQFKFVTYLNRTYTRAVFAMFGNKRARVDGKLKCILPPVAHSLNELMEGEGKDTERIDALEDVGGCIYEQYEREELRRVMAGAISRLDEKEQKAVHGRYYCEKTRAQLVDNKHFYAVNEVENAEDRALQRLRRDKPLRDFYYADFRIPELPAPESNTPEQVAVAGETVDEWLYALNKELEGFTYGY